MILRLVWENIRFRPLRTLLSILLIGVPVMLILTLVGVSEGFMDDSHRRAQGVGADIFVWPPGHSFTSGNSVNLAEGAVGVLAKQPHVAQAEGVATVSAGTMPWDTLTGIDYPAFKKMSGGFIVREGDESKLFSQPNDIVVTTSLASQHRPSLHPGDKVTLDKHEWTVAAVVEPGIMSNAFVDLRQLQELNGTPRKISQVYLKLDDPANVSAVIDELEALPALEGYSIYSTKQVVELMSTENIPAIKVFVRVIIGIGIFTGLFVVSLSMYMAVLQRTREIGILKSLGATKGFVMSLILWEAVFMGFGGTIAGIALSFGSRAALKYFVAASMPQAIVPIWWPIVCGIALGSALLGALYPGIIAVRHDPIEALAYE